MPVLVKICGTTSPTDARLAHEAGADFLGVILNHPPSPRHVAREVAHDIRLATSTPIVVLTVNQPLETLLQIGADFSPRALQLHGDETPELVEELVKSGLQVWKAVSGDTNAVFTAAEKFRAAGAEAILVDARETSSDGIVYGGTGHLADWNAARHLVDEGYRVILAGGLTPENVGRAVAAVQPWSVDVVSGVEARKGLKDVTKLREFASRAKSL
ncbi:phosphoribosylanthranilate isomerase [bacterium]|nr:MAG: phosphoribosylanthranilate isomerase [bacterium]